MEKKSLFLRKMEEKGLNLLIPDNINNLPCGRVVMLLVDTIRSCINMTRAVDFKCDFDDKGICSGMRKRAWIGEDSLRAKMCCCASCYSALGYLTSAPPISEIDLPTYERLFKRKIGFWRRGKGCSLPRHLRSVTCVFYTCGNEVAHRVPLSGARHICTRAIEEIKGMISKDLKKIAALKQRRLRHAKEIYHPVSGQN
jgi:hypothetical protein